MVAQWTSEMVGEMHTHNITRKLLAVTLGMSAEYVGAVLKGKRTPKHAELKFKTALTKLITEKADIKDNQATHDKT